jgi:hypothetical protein
MSEKRQKTRELATKTFTDIPYQIIIEILNDCFLINYTKMFVKYVVKENKDKNAIFEDLVKSFVVKCFFGYFKTDRWRKVFLLFRSIKLKDRVVTEYYGRASFGYCLISFGGDEKPKNVFCVGCDEIEMLKLLPEMETTERTDDDVWVTEYFTKLSFWLLPKDTNYMKIVQEINETLYYKNPKHIPDEIDRLDVTFKGYMLGESTGNLDHEIIEKFSKLKKYPNITFDYYIFGGWPMYHFIKNKNTKKEWKITLVDCKISEVVETLKDECEHLLNFDKRPLTEKDGIIKEASNIMWEIRTKHSEIVDERQKKLEKMKEEIDTLKKDIEKVKKELIEIQKRTKDIVVEAFNMEKLECLPTYDIVIKTQEFLKKQRELSTKCMDLILKTKTVEKFDPNLDVEFEVKIGKITLKFVSVGVGLF